MNAPGAGATPRRRKLLRVAGALGVLLLLLALSLRIALRPEHVTRQVLQRAGDALGLEISATGVGEYQLRGTPRLVVRGVVAREPGARTALLRAERIAIAVPWSTLRSRGALLDVDRVELDAPVLDLAALRAWQAGRPPSTTRVPTLTSGLRITRGRIDGGGWRVEGIALELPRLHADRPLALHARGRYVDAPTQVAFDLHVAATRPANHAGTAAVGTIAIRRDDWRLPARVRLSGPLHAAGGALQLTPLRLATVATYAAGTTRLPFALGVHGTLRMDGTTSSLAPAWLALRAGGALADADAHGAIALGRRLVVRLDGILPTWPARWPALPPPISQSRSPLPFRLEYAGKADFGDVAALRLRRDASRFDGRFRLPDMLRWSRQADGSPLPPLDGVLAAPSLEISGATLDGVEIEIDDPGIEDAPPR